MKKTILTTFILTLFSITAKLAFTYSASAPPAAHTNAPGEANCTACHGSFPLTTSGPLWNGISLTSSVPLSQFLPGQTYTLSLTFADPARTKYGFELVALPTGATGSTASIGILTATSLQTNLQIQGSREYISHSATGTAAPSNTKTWTFDWETPTGYSGDVDFYVVVNSTNADGSNSGDRVYAKVFSSTVLPVKWLTYEVKTEKSGNHIKWSTASEQNSQHFEIEKSLSGTDWTQSGIVKAKGNSNQIVKYSFFDAVETSVKTYYRIKQVDMDGRFEYSKILTSEQHAAPENVSYDPLTNRISITNAAMVAPATLFSLSGIPVSEDLYGELLDVASVDRGIYLLKLPSGKYQKIFIY